MVPQALAAADVTRVQVEVSGPGISSPLTAELARSGNTWSGTVSGIPAGTGRLFRASAHDSASKVIYVGEAGPIAIEPGKTASVSIVLQQVEPQVPFENEAPRIDSVAVSSNVVEPGGSVVLKATAHDANGDTLRFNWSATAGTFSAPGSAETTWTAPATEGAQRIQLEVVDSKGASATMSLDIGVFPPGATGSAVVTASFNTWPSIVSMNGVPSVLEVGGSTRLSATVTDMDGDVPGYFWESSCVGRFDNPTLASPSFSLTALPAGGRCAFKLQVTDPRGGYHLGSLILHAGSALPPGGAPQIDATWQSNLSPGGGELVTLGVSAHDPEGGPLGFSWSASAGTLVAERSNPLMSEIDWRAPTCFDSPASVMVVVNDGTGAMVKHEFLVTPRPGSACTGSMVTGQRYVTHVLPGGYTQTVPLDLSAATIGAFVPTAEGSAYTWLAGSGQPLGTFLIPEVPAGSPYLLRYGQTYIWTDKRSVDLGYAALGRPNAELEPEGTRLEFQLDGLSPWTFLDDLQLHSPSAGMDWVSLYGCPLPADLSLPAEGSTSFTGSTDYSGFVGGCGNRPVHFEPASDRLYVAQLAGRTDAATGTEYQELRRGFFNGGPERTATGSLLLKGTMAVLPTFQQSLTVRSSEFESLARAAHPSATVSYNTIDLGTLQNYREFGTYAAWPDVGLAFDYTPGDGDLSPVFEIGDLFPREWPLFSNVQMNATVRYTIALPDGTTSKPRSFSALAIAREPLERGSHPLITPKQGPARELRLNGLDATGKLTGVGTTPLLSWAAPTLGTPTYYQLRLYRLFASADGFLNRSPVANLYTPQTQLRLPPGLLNPGQNYYVQVVSYWKPGTDPSNPYTQSAVSHSASAVTGTFMP